MIEPIVYWAIAVLSFLLPFVALVLIILAKRSSGLRWWLHVLVSILLLGFCYQAGVWAMYSIYLKYVFVAAGLALIIWSWPPSHGSRSAVLRKLVWFGIVGLLVLANGLTLKGKFHPSESGIELEFPLRNGKFYVLQGGNSPISNFFHVRNSSQKYAVDIVRLNGFGARARGIIPSNLERYEVYGDTVFSPCEGVVVAAVDGLPESVPPTMKAEHALGNGVILAIGDNRRIMLAHLMPGSVTVRNGQRVLPGEPLGLVGNSGRSAEPHLHIMAVQNSEPKNFFSGKPLPMRFKGRFLSLNSVIRN